MNLAVRDTREERLDATDHDARQLSYNMKQLTVVNRWLGGNRVLRKLFKQYGLYRAKTVLDVGTGAGDIPRMLTALFEGKGGDVRICALDLQPAVARIAHDWSRRHTNIAVGVASGTALPLRDKSIDVAVSSMTIHHFDDASATKLVAEMNRVSRRAVIVTDLDRSRFGYLGAKLLAKTLWRNDWYARHDGPLSVLRAFRSSELRSIGERAGLREVHMARHIPSRLTMVGIPA